MDMLPAMVARKSRNMLVRFIQIVLLIQKVDSDIGRPATAFQFLYLVVAFKVSVCLT